MPSAAAIRELVATGPFGVAGRFKLTAVSATRWHRRGLVGIPLRGGGEVFLDRRTLDSDLETLREIFVPRKNPYGADYGGAVVIDVGAHKGYFGAFALLGGARCVVSYEPASENFALLERAAASFRRRGMQWEARQSAVGEESGSAVLSLSAESWTHSIHAPLPASGPAQRVSSEVVSVAAGRDVLDDARRRAAGGRLVVKIDAEGAECEICRAAASAWDHVDELFVETHDSAPCTVDDLLAEPQRAGLAPVENDGPVLRLTRSRTGAR